MSELPSTVMALDFHDRAPRVDRLIPASCWQCGHTFTASTHDGLVQCPSCHNREEHEEEAEQAREDAGRVRRFVPEPAEAVQLP